MTKLPINIADLLTRRRVESERIEYKSGWNPEALLCREVKIKMVEDKR
jgi:ATP-dependent DNA helicase RecG